MIFTEATLSYPCVEHRVEVSHFTARKSTAIEWLILESISKCERLANYQDIAIGVFFKHIFTISDADILIKPVLISLQDMGAITVVGIDDETELDTVPMRNLQLTNTGREMQLQGLLPGATSEETLLFYYDIVAKELKFETNIYKEESTGIHVIDIDNADETEFPEGKIREWLFNVQNGKKNKKLNWLAPTTRIDSVTCLNSELRWKNITRKVELVEGMRWKVSGVEEESIHERTLEATELFCPDDFRNNLPYLEIANPNEEIKKFIQFSEVNSLILDLLQKNNMFCVATKYYKEIKPNQQNKKNIRIGIVYGADEFKVDNNQKQIIIYVPDCDFSGNRLYFDSRDSIVAGITTVSAGDISKEVAIAFMPNKNEIEFRDILTMLIDKYYTQNSVILFALYELGMKDRFMQYAEQVISAEEQIANKAKLIESFNEKSKSYYGKNVISPVNKDRLLINEAYIAKKCHNIEEAKSVLSEFAEINIFRQDETLFHKIIKLVIEYMGKQDSLEDIWGFWHSLSSIKKGHVNWATKCGLYKNMYSKKSVLDFINRFTDENIFEIEEYTAVEQIILNMRRISLQIEGLLPEIDLYSTVSDEKYNEIVLLHTDVIENIYDKVRKWQDEEERFNNIIIDLGEIMIADTHFANVKKNMEGLRNATALFFDDSFMKFNQVYIVDTCTLMHEPNLISWFDDGKALLVIPMTALEELDGLKNDENAEKAYKAREIIRNISNYKAYDWLNVGELSYSELLPKDLDPEKNDNKILSIAIKYCTKKPILLTDDINLGNVTGAMKIENMTLESYQAMKKYEKLANTNKGNNKKSKKKKK